tara:strand:+ start:2766 stop:3746 length:981 start_codon:yes stop_codon:yes gene_type:complete
MNFVDHATIYVKAGKGGNGCIAFLREKFRPKGGPCGGDGGHGGNIILKADSNLSTLHDLKYNKKYIAQNGENGKTKNMHGKNGLDTVISLPLGTIVKNSESNELIVDLDQNNQSFIIAKGGNGGFGNARFKTKINTAPRIANDGLEGSEINLELELKILADIGLVGFPNAGKSTFIRSISNAKPKIADYPFTTLVPNLGIVKYLDYKTYVVADIPGIIEGASMGKGLGIQFLKHIERTKVLVFIIDVNSQDINYEYKALCLELEKYSKDLLKKPKLLFITKSDVKQQDIDVEIENKSIKWIEISSLEKTNIKEAKNMMFEVLESLT